MKKLLTVFLSLLLLALLMTGCEKEHQHTWVLADCTSPKYCEICGMTIGEPIGHDWFAATCTSAKRCNRCGLTEGQPAEHTWMDATCTEPKTCTVCHTTEGNALGHDMVGMCGAEAACSRCGAVVAVLAHDWIDATCDNPQTCGRCGLTEGTALGHDWKDATCTEPKTCSRCKATEGAALGHTWTLGNCTTPRTCIRCSMTEGKAWGHSYRNGKCTLCGEFDPNYIPPGTFESNVCYEVVEEATYTNSIGTTIKIYKVLARKDCRVEGTVLAYDKAGNVVGKSTDSIILTSGKNNYFKFTFDGNVSNATMQKSFKETSDSLLHGDRKNTVEMEQYNLSGDYLYITFKQVGNEIESFAKFKILYYLKNKIVDEDFGYFSTYVSNLTGKGSVDVAKIWAYGVNFDRIEYIFEP